MEGKVIKAKMNLKLSSNPPPLKPKSTVVTLIPREEKPLQEIDKLDGSETRDAEEKILSSFLTNAVQAQKIVSKGLQTLADPRKASSIATEQIDNYVKLRQAMNGGFQVAPNISVLIQLNNVLNSLPPMPSDYETFDVKAEKL
jgi:hypothetical protein